MIINHLNAELNPICHLLALLGGATIVVVSRLRVNVETVAGRRNKLAMIKHLVWTKENHSESQHSWSPRRYSNSGSSTDNHYTSEYAYDGS